MPIGQERFQAYLTLLKGNSKDDMVLPIGGFNPMAKPQVLEKLLELKSLNAEQIIENTIEKLNQQLIDLADEETFNVCINLADDMLGGWTNRFTTDYDSKFKTKALFARKFCTPFFWTSEMYTEELIIQRTRDYVFRTIYFHKNGQVKTLQEHINQEIFVAQNCPKSFIENCDYQDTKKHFEKHKDTEEYTLIFNFLYGDIVSQTLAFPMYGMAENAGFNFAQFEALNLR